MISGVRAVLLALGLGLPGLASAQTTADPVQATAARDSVLQFAATTRRALEQSAEYFVVAAPRLGRRRITTRGYRREQIKYPAASSGRRLLLWKHVTRTRRSGSTEERFYGYSGINVVLREMHHNHQLTYLEVTSYKPEPYVSRLKPSKQGLLTRTGYVRWGSRLFILPAAGGGR